MRPVIGTHTILIGDVMAGLATLPDQSVNACVTSPPYWGLRRYGNDPAELGQETTPEAYIARLVGIFAEVRRTLRDDGTLWCNIGDSYHNGDKGGHERSTTGKQATNRGTVKGLTVNRLRQVGLKPKDLIGVPWMLAFALRADGWYLRGDHIWGKPNGMPESVEDRPGRGHEYVFLLSKSERYSYDRMAVRTAPKASTITRLAQDIDGQAGSVRANGGARADRPMKTVRSSDKQRGHSRRHDGFNDRWDAMEREEDQMAEGANLRSIWWIPPAQFADAHFAVMPERVAEICIRAGCPEGGTVLDPFAGSGTVGAVACPLGRNFIGCELYPDYAAMAERRIGQAKKPGTFRSDVVRESELFTSAEAEQ